MSGHIDKKYWEKLKQGDLHSLGKLYDLFIHELFAYGMSISADKAAVMDAIHDLFLNLFKYHRKLSDVENVKAYLLRSLKTSLYRRDNRIKTISLEDSAHKIRKAKIEEQVHSHETQIIELEQSLRKKEKISQAMDLLTLNQQKVVHMRFKEDKSYEEIAAVMRVSIASARTIIYRALKILRGGVLILLVLLS